MNTYRIQIELRGRGCEVYTLQAKDAAAARIAAVQWFRIQSPSQQAKSITVRQIEEVTA